MVAFGFTLTRMSGIPALFTVRTDQTINASADLDPGIRPPMRKGYRVLVWFLGIGLFLTLLLWPFVVITVARFAAWEEICLGRHPWWGPPEPGVDNGCQGAMYERRQLGIPNWWDPNSGPK
jgi:hypothetical protein